MQPDKQELKSLEAGLDQLQLTQAQNTKRALTERILAPILAIALLGVIWQWAFAQEFQPEWVLPSPSMVWEALKMQWDQGFVLPSVTNSLKRAFIGFALSVVVATPIGIVVAKVRYVRATLGPVLAGLQQLPSVAWVPAAVIWFGLTDTAILVVILLGAVPSIANGLVAGIDQIPPLYLRAGKAWVLAVGRKCGISLLPASLPGYLAGLEQGWAFAWRSLMAAELIAISPQLGPGLGQLLQTGRELGDMSLVIGSIILILIAGIFVERFGFAPIRRRVLVNRGLQVK